ncbi:MAG TPA: cyclic nucleotide-binding domain-containing protein [Oligoflexus sp.]|uniref:Crp/Fnr family transcriptional regulator n=1 Tax=Oligoflexus sp. TaxID=1971216 RepID=UPI002D34BC42|nr:cyclic nucleotide-binding domain-containing protein [Oligoflexus sp.]HYX38721.1 cyclic nucleotide-binding domain-containing protein [Oligoflexus sp.]
MAIKDLLKDCPLFFELYDDEIENVVKDQKVHHFEKDEKIIEEGQRADQIFILLEGVADLQKATPGGRIRVERLKQGEVFGLLMLLDETPYSIDVIAQTRCSVLEIKHQSIIKLFDKKPRIFAIMTLNICRILGRRLKSAYTRMSQLKVPVGDPAMPLRTDSSPMMDGAQSSAFPDHEVHTPPVKRVG